MLEATVRLVEDAPSRALAVLGYPTMADAADAVPGAARAATTWSPARASTQRIADLVARRRARAAARAPAGCSSRSPATPGRGAGAGRGGAADGGRCRTGSSPTPAEQAGAVADPRGRRRARRPHADRARRTPAGRTPPSRRSSSGAYLRDFDALLDEHGLHGVPYGHFGDGCVHVRIDFPLRDAGGRAGYRDVRRGRRAAWSRRYGGSLSGEHGDGRARSELLPLMYYADALALFGGGQARSRPRGPAQPRRPRRPGAARRRSCGRPRAGRRPRRRCGCRTTAATCPPPCTAAPASASAWPTTPASGRDVPLVRRRPARRRTPPAGGPGCSRRRSPAAGRRRVATPAVHEALDLCLSCKGCARDCPTGVDMATYKAEVLHQSYAGRRRPRCALHAGPAAAVGRSSPRRGWSTGAGRNGRRGWPSWRAGIDRAAARSTRGARCPRSASRCADRRRRPTAGRPTWRSGPTPSPTTSPPTSPTPRRGAGGAGLTASR